MELALKHGVGVRCSTIQLSAIEQHERQANEGIELKVKPSPVHPLG